MKRIEKILSENVIKRRKLLKMSQAELSKLSKISINTISRLENMKQIPQASNLEAIARVLGTTRDDLFKDHQGTPTIQALNDIIRFQEKEIEVLRKINSVNDLSYKLFKEVPLDVLNLLVNSKHSWDVIRAALGVNVSSNVRSKKESS